MVLPTSLVGVALLLAPLHTHRRRSVARPPAPIPQIALLGQGGMPMLGFGMGGFQGRAAAAAARDYLLMGGRHLDTAVIYGNHREVGRGIREAVELGVPREEIFLSTKIPGHALSFSDASAATEQLLTDLGVAYVDLLLLHTPAPRVFSGRSFANMPCKKPRACRQEAWLAVERFKSNGRVRAVGVSNFGPKQMADIMALNTTPIAVNQMEYHPFVPETHRNTVRFCRRHGIAVIAHSLFGADGHFLRQRALVSLGRSRSRSAAQILIRWALQHNISAVTFSTSHRRMQQNMEVFDFELSPEEMALIDSQHVRALVRPQHRLDLDYDRDVE